MVLLLMSIVYTEAIWWREMVHRGLYTLVVGMVVMLLGQVQVLNPLVSYVGIGIKFLSKPNF